VLENLKQYLEGNVYGVITEKHELTENQTWEFVEEVDSLWGFYGDKYAEEEAEAMVNNYWGETAKPEPTPAEYADAA